MSNAEGIVFGLLALTSGYFGVASFLDYHSKTAKGSEIKLLKTASSCLVENSSQRNPKEALDYTMRVIEVCKNNPSIRYELGDLEQAISQVRTEIGNLNAPVTYQFVFSDVNSRINYILENKAKNYWDLVPVFIDGIGLCFFGYESFKNFREARRCGSARASPH